MVVLQRSLHANLQVIPPLDLLSPDGVLSLLLSLMKLTPSDLVTFRQDLTGYSVPLILSIIVMRVHFFSQGFHSCRRR